MAIVKVKSIEDLRLPDKELMIWSKSKIYYKNGKYLKILNSCDRLLSEGTNYNRLQVLEKLSELKDIKYLELPQNLYITDKEFLGYSMPICLGKPLDYLTEDIAINKVIKMVMGLLEDIQKISAIGILNPDIWGGNVLFDKNNLYLIDFDNCIYFDDIDMAYKIMGMSLFNLIIDRMLDSYDLNWLNDIDINYIKERIDNLESTDYIAFINLLKFKLARKSHEKIETVGDMRRCLRNEKLWQ